MPKLPFLFSKSPAYWSALDVRWRTVWLAARVFARLLAIVVTVTMSVSTSADVIGRRSLIGVNLAGPTSLGTQWDFVDLMKGANVWVYDGGPNAGQPTPLDVLGNPILQPGQQANTLPRLKIVNSTQNRVPDYPVGQYTITWEGSGEFFLSGDGDFEFISANGAGSRPFDVATGHETLFLKINASDPADPLRNIHIYMPGYGPSEPNAGQRFHHAFVERMIRPFGSVRYMGWSHANGTTHSEWSQRTRDDANQYTVATGVPLEEQLRLAALGNGDVWFTMPTHASDDYIAKFARAALYGIDSDGNPYASPQVNPHVSPVPADRTIYVEYGNEVWNSQFEGFDYVTQQAIAAGLSPSGLDEDFTIQWAAESTRDFEIWTAEFALAGQLDRLKRVAAIQSGNRFISPLYLKAMTIDGVPQFDVISPAFYVGVNSGSYNVATTADDIIDDLFETLAENLDPTETVFLPGTPFEVVGPRGDWLLWKQFADEANVELIAYEGGQHVVPPSFTASWYDAYLQAQRDPRMYDLYTAWLEAIFDTVEADGVEFFSSVSHITQFGAWGALEYQDQETSEAPKYRALVDFARRLGDFNLDGRYDDHDIDALRAAIGLEPVGENAVFDLNADGDISERDVQALLSERLKTSYGDANLDGVIDDLDFDQWRAGFATGGDWARGDFNGDGSSDAADYIVWRRNRSTNSMGSQSVPEPGTWVLAVLAITSLRRCCRSRR